MATEDPGNVAGLEDTLSLAAHSRPRSRSRGRNNGLARTAFFSSSARVGWGKSGSRNRSSRYAGGSPSKSSRLEWIRSRSSPASRPSARRWRSWTIRPLRRSSMAGPHRRDDRTSSWSTWPASPSRSTATGTPSDRAATASAEGGLRRRPACPPEGHHPPGLEALEHPRFVHERKGAAKDHRLWNRQGDGLPAHREDSVHRAGRGHRHAGVHESRAGRSHRPGRRHADRRVLARSHPLPAPHRRAPLWFEELRSSSYEELRRKLREVEPRRPSTRLSTPTMEPSRRRETETPTLEVSSESSKATSTPSP